MTSRYIRSEHVLCRTLAPVLFESAAMQHHLQVFEKKVAEHKSSGKKSDIDVNSLSGPEALAKPGTCLPLLAFYSLPGPGTFCMLDRLLPLHRT